MGFPLVNSKMILCPQIAFSQILLLYAVFSIGCPLLYTQQFTIDVNEEFLQFIDNGALAVEVWGHRRSGFLDMGVGLADGDSGEEKKQKSFPEK